MFQLNLIDFGYADILLLEQKFYESIEAIEVLIKSLIDSFMRENLHFDESEYRRLHYK